MQTDENTKLQKKIDMERGKEERARKKRKVDEELTRKREQTAIKRMNKSRQVCSDCGGDKKDDKKNKSRWTTCFDCSKWCCYDCLPSIFSTACSQVYRCQECSQTNEVDETNEE